YVDVMCQMTDAKPISVYAIGARLTNDIPMNNYNYGQLQIRFDDGSVGWYEAGWGPMVSETAFFCERCVWTQRFGFHCSQRSLITREFGRCRSPYENRIHPSAPCGYRFVKQLY